MKRFLFLVLIFLSLFARAEVYKWTDEEGTVHYGDRPVSGTESIELNIEGAQTVRTVGGDLSREEKRQKLLEAMEEDRIEKQEARTKQKAERDKRRKRCNYLKDKQRRFRSASGIYNLDKDGNRVYQSAKRRKLTEDRIQKQINKYCR